MIPAAVLLGFWGVLLLYARHLDRRTKRIDARYRELVEREEEVQRFANLLAPPDPVYGGPDEEDLELVDELYEVGLFTPDEASARYVHAMGHWNSELSEFRYHLGHELIQGRVTWEEVLAALHGWLKANPRPEPPAHMAS